MATSVFHQSSFLGGEWAAVAQGRSDTPAYKTALNVSLNGIPIEEGAWVRRSGFEYMGPTRGKAATKLIPYVVDGANPWLMEFTNNSVKFWANSSPILTIANTTITASSFAANVLSLTLTSGTGFTVGEDIMIGINTSTADYAKLGAFRNRVMRILTKAGVPSVITLADETGAAFSGVTSTADDLVGFTIFQIARITSTPWVTADLPNLRKVQTADAVIILSASAAPVTITPSTSNITVCAFIDGPYLDQQGTFETPETGTVNAYSGSITFTPASSTFTSTDVGRLIRLYTQPAAWSNVTTYAYGDTVTYKNEFWRSIASGSYASLNVGITPGTLATSGGVQVVVWAPAADAPSWAWGTITAQASSSCTVSLQTPLTSSNGATVAAWQLGVYMSGQYPTCGLYHEGRLWLGGAVANRFDASSSNDPFNFAPTDSTGIVLDSSGISETLNAEDKNVILWMVPDHQGVLMGTTVGEWLISASALNDPLTSTSIQAHRVTRYGCANVEPLQTGMAHIFVQRYGQRVMEYLADAFSGRFTGRHVNEFAKHITTTGVSELAYQEEKAPVIWTRMADGNLAGCTYRRVSRFVTEAPVFQAWHPHQIGGTATATLVCKATSMSVLPSSDNLSDTLFVATSNTSDAKFLVEQMRPLYMDQTSLTTAWFLDHAIGRGVITTIDGSTIGTGLSHRGLLGKGGTAVAGVDTTLTIYGLYYLADNFASTCALWIKDRYIGDYTISANGTISVTLSSSTFTAAQLIAMDADWGEQTATLSVKNGGASVITRVPMLVGNTYIAQGQRLRPATQDDIKSATGAALGKTRRTTRVSVLVENSVACQFGTTLNPPLTGNLLSASFPGSTAAAPIAAGETFSGVYRFAINDSDSFDSMVCWQLVAPYPLTICAMSSFIEASDP